MRPPSRSGISAFPPRFLLSGELNPDGLQIISHLPGQQEKFFRNIESDQIRRPRVFGRKNLKSSGNNFEFAGCAAFCGGLLGIRRRV